jgi:hypothetical protein
LAIEAIYKEFNRETGRWLYALKPDDFEKVRQGYACPNCLEDFGGVILVKCPVCPHVRSEQDFVDLPNYMIPEPDPVYHD